MREDRRAGNVVGEGKDDGGGEDALDGGEDDLLDGDEADGEGTHDAVVDFAGDAELLGEGEGYGGDAREHDGDGHEAGKEDGAEASGAGHACGGAEAGASGHVGHDEGEDEEEEQRVHARCG